jgi:hypothetical protein
MLLFVAGLLLDAKLSLQVGHLLFMLAQLLIPLLFHDCLKCARASREFWCFLQRLPMLFLGRQTLFEESATC